MGQTLAQTMGQPAAASGDATAKLAQLKQMFEQSLITAEEYAAKKKQILDGL
jgi:hypothetical protein